MAEMKADQKIDLRGVICPYTLIEARDKLKEMAQGQVLEVLSDYEPAVKETFPNFFKKKGYPFEVTEEGPDLWRLFIRRTD